MNARALRSVLGGCLLVTAPQAIAAGLSILVVDVEHLESQMPLYAEIDRLAGALVSTGPQAASARQLAAELRKSEVLTAVPEVIAQIAATENADLVLDRETASRIGEGGARDVTAAVQQALERQFSGRPLELAQ